MNLHTITVRTPGPVDQWGDQTAPTTTTIPGCTIYPTTSDDVGGRGRDGAVTGLSIIVPYGTAIAHNAHVQIPAPWSDSTEWWPIVGDSADWSSPFTDWAPGSIVKVQRGEG